MSGSVLNFSMTVPRCSSVKLPSIFKNLRLHWFRADARQSKVLPQWEKTRLRRDSISANLFTGVETSTYLLIGSPVFLFMPESSSMSLLTTHIIFDETGCSKLAKLLPSKRLFKEKVFQFLSLESSGYNRLLANTALQRSYNV
jgi:hypothetical protein